MSVRRKRPPLRCTLLRAPSRACARRGFSKNPLLFSCSRISGGSFRIRVKFTLQIARAQVFDAGRGRGRGITQSFRRTQVLVVNVSIIWRLLFEVIGEHNSSSCSVASPCVKKRQAGNLTLLMSENNDAVQGRMINRASTEMVAMRLQRGSKLILPRFFQHA